MFYLPATLIFLAPVTMSGAPTPQIKKEDLIKDDVARLEGKWRVVSYQANGIERDLNAAELTFSGRDYSWSDGSPPGTIEEIDPTLSPKQVAYKTTDGAKKGTIYYGIYMIAGDIFVDCFGRSENERPKEFVSKPDSGHTLVVYKRIRKDQ
jgi:uncharacterized protein (TIGR03067 family)